MEVKLLMVLVNENFKKLIKVDLAMKTYSGRLENYYNWRLQCFEEYIITLTLPLQTVEGSYKTNLPLHMVQTV